MWDAEDDQLHTARMYTIDKRRKRNCQRYNIYREAAFFSRVKTSVRSLNLKIAYPGRSSDRGGSLANRTEARNEI
nr:hypothetical protein [Tanacetum cinerariifolium]